MKIKRVTAIFFSPCGNAEKAATIIARGIGDELNVPVEYDDFTLPENRMRKRLFEDDDLVVFALPVYAGRIPNKVLPFVQSLFEGNHTLVIPMVLFGNRSYDNALKELCFELDTKGFLPIGAAAWVSEHSFSNKLASGRPDEEDIVMMREFAEAVMKKLKLRKSHSVAEQAEKEISGMIAERKAYDICPSDINHIFLDIDEIPGEWPLEKYYTPLGVDGKPAFFLKAKPKTDISKCNHCGICAVNCPMGSISREDVNVVSGICMKCQACVKKCPQGARYFDDEAFLSHVKMLEQNYSCRKESSVFI